MRGRDRCPELEGQGGIDFQIFYSAGMRLCRAGWRGPAPQAFGALYFNAHSYSCLALWHVVSPSVHMK